MTICIKRGRGTDALSATNTDCTACTACGLSMCGVTPVCAHAKYAAIFQRFSCGQSCCKNCFEIVHKSHEGEMGLSWCDALLGGVCEVFHIMFDSEGRGEKIKNTLKA